MREDALSQAHSVKNEQGNVINLTRTRESVTEIYQGKGECADSVCHFHIWNRKETLSPLPKAMRSPGRRR
jgi:hypothetical protein